MKPMRSLLLFACLWALMLALAAPAGAVEVQAEGVAAVLNNNVAGARKQALLNAQRNAVEQGVGLMIDSQTMSENFQVIRDQVLTASQGFVTRYTVVEEGPTQGGQSYRVKIKAEVSEDLLEDRLSALRILHQRMGNKRVMVIYESENPHALERNHGAVRSALQTIRTELNKSGFRLFNQAATDQVYGQIERATRTDRPVEDLIAMALDQRADILVRFEDVAGKRGPQGGLFSAAYATIRISVFDTNTGRQIADAMAEGKQLLRADAGPYDWEKGLAEASVKASEEASKEAVNRIVSYYEQVGDVGYTYLLVFRGFDDDHKDIILDYLENTPGFKNMTELKNTIDYLEVELFSTEDASRMRRMLRAGLKDKGITVQTQLATRNRIVFSNPESQPTAH